MCRSTGGEIGLADFDGAEGPGFFAACPDQEGKDSEAQPEKGEQHHLIAGAEESKGPADGGDEAGEGI